MAIYIIKYWFEHGGTCLWSINDLAKNKFDYPIDNDSDFEIINDIDRCVE